MRVTTILSTSAVSASYSWRSVETPALRGEPLLAPIWRDGDALVDFDLQEARDRAADQLDALPDHWRRIDRSLNPPRPRRSDVLEALAREVRDRETTHRR